MTLDDWTHGVAHHLRMIKSDARDIMNHASSMRARPDLHTITEDELLMCHDVLAGVLAQVRQVINIIREKPTDAP